RPSTEMRSPGSLAFFSPRRLQPAGASEASNSAAKSRRFMCLSGTEARSGLGSESGDHLRGAGADPLRRRQIVRKIAIELKRTGLVARFQPHPRGPAERRGAKWI